MKQNTRVSTLINFNLVEMNFETKFYPPGNPECPITDAHRYEIGETDVCVFVIFTHYNFGEKQLINDIIIIFASFKNY